MMRQRVLTPRTTLDGTCPIAMSTEDHGVALQTALLDAALASCA